MNDFAWFGCKDTKTAENCKNVTTFEDACCFALKPWQWNGQSVGWSEGVLLQHKDEPPHSVPELCKYPPIFLLTPDFYSGCNFGQVYWRNGRLCERGRYAGGSSLSGYQIALIIYTWPTLWIFFTKHKKMRCPSSLHIRPSSVMSFTICFVWNLGIPISHCKGSQFPII